MPKTSLRVKASRPAKFKVRNYNRCRRCGRARAFYRRFALCRICLRQLALDGKLPGVVKASW
jgi:small subunit ribosomal protein S14